MAAKTIISIHANAPGVGKTTLAKALAREYAGNRRPVLLISFADKLREAGVEFLVGMGFARSVAKYYLTFGKDDKTHPIATSLLATGRSFLKAFGQSCRSLDADCFINPVADAIEAMPDNGVVIIDDCRQQNEYEKLCEMGARFVGISGLSYTGAEGNMEGILKESVWEWTVSNARPAEENAHNIKTKQDTSEKHR